MCKGRNLTQVIKLAPTPPANAFLSESQLKRKETFFPLKVNFCNNCGHLQLTHVVSPEILFRNYLYASSTSPVFINHFKEYADDITKRFTLNQKSFVIDIGSNDGILLDPLQRSGIRILGIDPAVDIAKKTSKNGIKTIPEFLTVNLAEKIVKKYGHADVVTANNAFAHIHDLDEIINSVKILLHDDGVFVIEFPYLIDFIQKNYFDLIYHEHLSYLSIRPLQAIFNRFDMKIFDLKKVDSHGGSMRIYVQKSTGQHPVKKIVNEYLQKEHSLGLDSIKTYQKFSRQIETNKTLLLKILKRLKLQGKTIVGYGAPAKGNTLLIHFKIGSKILDYIVDDSSYKQGLYTPGTHIKVVPSSQITQDHPDYILILAWNFAEPIMKKLADFKTSGGRFIIPVPKPSII